MDTEPPQPSEGELLLRAELQASMFEHMATLALGGVGLTITLIGGVLAHQPVSWLAAIEFAICAVLALAGQQTIVDGLGGRTNQRRIRTIRLAVQVLMGMAIGSLATAVILS